MYVFVVARLCLATLPDDSYFPIGSIIRPPFYGILTKQGLVAFYSAQTLLATDEKRIMPTSVCSKLQGPSSLLNLGIPAVFLQRPPPLPSSEDSWAWGGRGAVCSVLLFG